MKFLIAPLIICVFLIGIFFRIRESNFLYNYDSWDHYYLTEHGENRELFTDFVELGGGVFRKYRSLLRTITYLISKSFSISNYEIFRYGVIVLRAVYLVLIWLVLRLMNQANNFNKYINLVILSLIGSQYFLWRSFIFFPENGALILNILLILLFEQYLTKTNNKSKIIYIFLISLTTALSAYVHPIAFYYTIIIFVSYTVVELFKKNNFILIYFMIILTLTFLFPIFFELYNRLSNTLIGNFGINSNYGSIAKTMSQYTPPIINNFLAFLGKPILIMGVVGFIRIIKLKKYPLIIIYLLSFILSISNYFKLYLPTDRMMGYFLFISVLTAFYGYTYLFKKINKQKVIYVLFFIYLTLYSLNNYSTTKPWVSLSDSEIKLDKYLQQNEKVFSEKKLFFDNLKYQYYQSLIPENIVLELDKAEVVISKNQYDLTLKDELDELKIYEK